MLFALEHQSNLQLLAPSLQAALDAMSRGTSALHAIRNERHH